MSRISVNIRLRPVRFAFLVRPDDAANVVRIFRVNTCLWGGKYNPIIPCLTKVPKWWDRHGHKFETASEIVNGYLDFFEPDFVVETEAGLATGLGFDKERILSFSQLLRPEGERHWDGVGLNVFELYRYLYRKEFQFARRHDHNIVGVRAEDPRLSGMLACLFGSFPEQPEFAYIAKGFEDAFAPKRVTINAEQLQEVYKLRGTSALTIGHAEIDVEYHDQRDPTLFVFDAFEPRDLIDYWNLRAVRRWIIPIPVQWITELSGFCREFITANHRPLPDNRYGLMIETTVLFSRSIRTDAIEQLHQQYLAATPPAVSIRQDWYPTFWRPSPDWTIREMRPTLSAGKKAVSCLLDGDNAQIEFDTLHPDFVDEHGNKNRWANVVRLRDWTAENQVATTFPTNYRNPKVPRFRYGDDPVLPTTEGFVCFPRFIGLSEHWRLSDGSSAMKAWLKANGVAANLSDAGRSTQQITRALGTFGVRTIANAQIVELLNGLSRRPRSPSAHYLEIRNRVRNAVKDDIWRSDAFESLVQREVLELGLELKCTKCSSWNWYSLKQLDYHMRCQLCLQAFDFPVLDPGSSDYSRWAYRLIGPFALPDYAGGGYTSSLSIRFFRDVLGPPDSVDVTWSAGQNLELGADQTIEADFILWYQRKVMFGNDHPTNLVFGEAKSFGKDTFKAEDVNRMKELALRFPGSTLVFATMKSAAELSAGEKERMSKLALWGREAQSAAAGTRAPVIVLTGMELFASYGLREAWEKAGDKQRAFCEAGMLRFENLSTLADLTQQLYLDLPPYHSWLEEKYRKRRARRLARQGVAASPDAPASEAALRPPLRVSGETLAPAPSDRGEAEPD